MSDDNIEVTTRDPGVFNFVAKALEALAFHIRSGHFVALHFEWHEGTDPKVKVAPRAVLDFIQLDFEVTTPEEPDGPK
jgi:hypothetical protein